MAAPTVTAHPSRADAMRGAALAGLLSVLLLSLMCDKPYVVAPPQAPGRPAAPAAVEVDDTCTVSVTTGHDPAICAVRLAWGDGDTTGWLADSVGDSVAVAHVWYWSALFIVRAQARNPWGVLSEWSEPCTVSVTGLPPFADSLLDSGYVDWYAQRIAPVRGGEYCLAAGCYRAADTAFWTAAVRLSDMSVTDSIFSSGASYAIGTSPDGEHAYVGCDDRSSGGGRILKLRCSDFTAVASALLAGEVGGVAVSPDNSQVWVGDYEGGNIIVLAAADLNAIDTIAVMTCPIAVTFDSAGTYAYVGYDAAAELTVIDVAARRVVGSVPVESDCVLDMEYSRVNNHLYATLDGDTCIYQSVDLLRQSVDFSFYTEECPFFEWVAVAPGGDWLYFGSEDQAFVAVARPGENRIRACVPVTETIEGALCVYDMAALPDGRLLVLDEMGALRLYGLSGGAGSARARSALSIRRRE